MTEQETKRGPGRPRKTEQTETASAETAPEQPEVSKRVKQTRQRRRRRDNGDFSAVGRKLHVDPSMKDPNFTYRWINGDEARVQNLTVHDDWDFVTRDMLENPQMEADNADIGTRVSRPVGKDENGKAVSAYLVRKPREFHEEDARKKRAAIDATVSDLRRGVVNDPQALSGDKAYVPQGGIQISD